MRLTAYGFLLGAFALSGSNIMDAGGLAQGGALKVIQKEREDLLEAQRDAHVANNESIKKLTSVLEKMADSLRKRG